MSATYRRILKHLAPGDRIFTSNGPTSESRLRAPKRFSGINFWDLRGDRFALPGEWFESDLVELVMRKQRAKPALLLDQQNA